MDEDVDGSAEQAADYVLPWERREVLTHAAVRKTAAALHGRHQRSTQAVV
jgi:hypothetical protein